MLQRLHLLNNGRALLRLGGIIRRLRKYSVRCNTQNRDGRAIGEPCIFVRHEFPLNL